MRIINQQIVDYVRQYSSQGYSFDQIRTFLIKNNVSSHDVDEAISVVKSSSQSFNVNPIESQLRNYFTIQSGNGYNIAQISSSLINQGYPIILVNKIAAEFNTVNLKHEVHFSRGTIIGILLIIIIASVSYFAVTNIFTKTSSSLLDESLSTDKYSYNPGDFITFQVHLTNMGSNDRVDVLLKDIIVDESNNVIASKDETVAMQTTESVTRDIMIPPGTPLGKYQLEVIASYGSNNAKSSNEFEVVTPTETNNNNVPNTIPTLTQPNTTIIPENVETPPSVTATGKTFGDLLSDVKAAAKTNPESVVSECSNLASQDQKDICYSVIADSSQSYNYCAEVTNVDYRDNCYLAFVMKGNVNVCQYINDADNKAFCNQLQLVQLMNQYYKDNNTAKVLELSKQFDPNIYNSNPQVKTYDYTYTEPVTIMSIVNTANVTTNTVPIVNITKTNITNTTK